ncbi:hypothetical protein RJZ56_004124 [Blastomyces dermatitidis]
MTDRAQIRLFNSSSSLHELHSALEELDLADDRRLRPGWDQYFMQLASLAAQRSNCMKRRVGCPCLTCSVKIAQLGISEVVYSQSYNMDKETASILQEAGVKLRQFSPPRNGLVYLQRFDMMISADHEVFNSEPTI